MVVKKPSKIILLLGIYLLIANSILAQCAGGAYWVNGTVPGGTLNTTGIVLAADSVFVNTTNPTSGSFAPGRPGYGIGGSSWNGINFQSLYMYRGGGRGSTTSFKLKTALDSFQIHFRVSDVRGDIFNWENQRILGYKAGVPVSASFKDPVNGVSISGNDIIGSSSTTPTVQSGTRIFFNGPVDSVVIISISSSDYVILEMMAMCDMILPLHQPINLYVKPKNTNTELFCTVKERGTYRLFRSINNIDWEEKGSREKLNAIAETIYFTDASPVVFKNYYRIQFTSSVGQISYSNIAIVDVNVINNTLVNVYPNPFTSNLTIQHKKTIIRISIFDSKGNLLADQKNINSNSTNMNIQTSFLPEGLYFLRIILGNGESITTPVLKK